MKVNAEECFERWKKFHIKSVSAKKTHGLQQKVSDYKKTSAPVRSNWIRLFQTHATDVDLSKSYRHLPTGNTLNFKIHLHKAS
jgi:hypothetical protein